MSELRFDDRVVIVTGAGTGIGRAHVELLAERGAALVVNDVDEAAASEVVTAVRAAGASAEVCGASVATEQGAAEVVATAVRRWGRVDAVINNAGLLRSAPVTEVTLDDWNEVLEVGLTGSFLVARAAWPVMVDGGGGRIVMTTSSSGLLGTPGSSAYAAAKAGLWGLIRTLALEGSEVSIAVNGLAPMAYTSMSASSRNAPAAWRDGTGDAWSARLDVAQVAPVAAWLCHDSCPLTGEVLSAAGGRVARFFLGLTEGAVSDALTIEQVRDRLDEIRDPSNHVVLGRAFDEGRLLHRRLMGRAGGPASPRRGGFDSGGQ